MIFFIPTEKQKLARCSVHFAPDGFPAKRQGTSPTVKAHLKPPHPTRLSELLSEFSSSIFYTLISKTTCSIIFYLIITWGSQNSLKNKNKKQGVVSRVRCPCNIWSSVTSVSPAVNLSRFAVIAYLSAFLWTKIAFYARSHLRTWHMRGLQ